MMTENEPLRPVSNLLLVRTPDLWWWAEDDDPINHLDLSIWAYHALVDAGVYRVAGVRDLDMESFAATRGVGTKIVGEVSLLRDVLRYRARAASPERAAFEANLPRNRIPLAWQTMLKDDRVESLGLSKRAREALAGAAT
ncbi:MAG: hypothetical protein GY711_13370, partial [bacterium]|nr:hypothetical protein [bacterium]